jgi:putative addiction module CopG family antidote
MPITAIKLPATFEKFVASQVREGTYSSRQAAIVAAVSHQMRRSEQRAWLETEVQKGLDSEAAVNSTLRRGSGAVAAGVLRVPAEPGADAASNRAVARSACRFRCRL